MKDNPHPEREKGLERRIVFRVLEQAIARLEHTQQCEGWYACTCIVGKASQALERLALDLQRTEQPAKLPPDSTTHAQNG